MTLVYHHETYGDVPYRDSKKGEHKTKALVSHIKVDLTKIPKSAASDVKKEIARDININMGFEKPQQSKISAR
tara:strand:+ start:734 stop:952 length:219 start_codon:yes stop_codon:yes gene_type:complete